MIERVLLVAWKGSQATQWLEPLRSGGYSVILEDTTGERAWRAAKERGIQAVIIDGSKKPSLGRAAGHLLRDTKKTEKLPIIWVNLSAEDAPHVMREVNPDHAIDAPTNAAQVLEALSALSHAASSRVDDDCDSLVEKADPTLHAHVHSLMGTPSYIATWTERVEPPALILDPDALPAPALKKAEPRKPASAPEAKAAKKPPAAKKAVKKSAAPKAKKTPGSSSRAARSTRS